MKIGDRVRVVKVGAGTEDALGTIRDGRAGRGPLPPGYDWLVSVDDCALEWYAESDLEVVK